MPSTKDTQYLIRPIEPADDARRNGYLSSYLETLERMTEARRLYEAAGFKRIDAPMGDTGHHRCDCWYVLEL